MKYSTRTDLVFDRTDEGYVVYNPDTGDFFELNETGEVIWQVMRDWVSLDELVTHLSEAFQVEEPELRSDVTAFIDQLQRRALLNVRVTAS